MLNVGLIGLGYWGPNLARVLSQIQRCKFVACCDLEPPQRLQREFGFAGVPWMAWKVSS